MVEVIGFNAALFMPEEDPAQRVRNLWAGLDGMVVTDLPSRIERAGASAAGYDDLMTWAKVNAAELDEASKAAIFDVIMQGRPSVQGNLSHRDQKIRLISHTLKTEYPTMTWPAVEAMLRRELKLNLSSEAFKVIRRVKF